MTATTLSPSFALDGVMGFTREEFVRNVKSRTEGHWHRVETDYPHCYDELSTDEFKSEYDQAEPLTFQECLLEEDTSKQLVMFASIDPVQFFEDDQAMLLSRKRETVTRLVLDENYKLIRQAVEIAYDLYERSIPLNGTNQPIRAVTFNDTTRPDKKHAIMVPNYGGMDFACFTSYLCPQALDYNDFKAHWVARQGDLLFTMKSSESHKKARPDLFIYDSELSQKEGFYYTHEDRPSLAGRPKEFDWLADPDHPNQLVLDLNPGTKRHVLKWQGDSPCTLDQANVLTVTGDGAFVTHPEHADIFLPPTQYVLGVQFEYDPIRMVMRFVFD